MSDILEKIKAFSADFNEKIKNYFPQKEGPEKRVMEAMEYAVSNGGKRLRPFLMCETAKLFDLSQEKVFEAALSLEMLHSYSLVHDDLPAMDNDDFRRGKPSCHKAFDEATAILAGDGLLTYAFEVLAKSSYSNDVKVKLIELLSRGAGGYDGMVAGQMLDLYAENAKNEKNPLELISRIEEMKTGRLLQYTIDAGAVIGGATQEELTALRKYARGIGKAFQIADDILDVTGDEQKVGKTLHKDNKENKLTFVSVCGLEKAKEMAFLLIDEAKESLKPFGAKANTLKDLADFIIERDY